MGDENKSLAMNREARQCRQKSAVSSPSNSKDRRQFLRRGGKRSHRDDSSGSSRSSQGSKPVQQETDTVVLERRQKQIDYGKNTLAYDQYLKKVPKESRPFFMPRTPDKNVQYSRRQWDGLIKAWKLQVHAWNADGKLHDFSVGNWNEDKKASGSSSSRSPRKSPSKRYSLHEKYEKISYLIINNFAFCNFNRYSKDGKKYSKLRKQEDGNNEFKSLMPNPPPPPQISGDIECGKNFDRSFNFSWCDDVEEEEEKRFDRLKNTKQET